MKVEIDTSEVEYGSYYKDEKCIEVEKVLRSDSRYAECEVKHVRWDEENNSDPFYVLDEKEEIIIILDRWKVYALSGSEVIPYIENQREQNRVSSRLETFMFSFAASVAFTLALPIAAGISFYFGDHRLFSVLMNLTIVAIILSFFVGMLYCSMHRSTTLRMKSMDMEAVREDHSFLDILRKLEEAPEVDKYRRKEFMKRIKHVEDTLANINS